MKMRSRFGVTRLGVLLVLASCLLMLAVVVPFVLNSREAARRTQCRNNLKQLGLALHNYHDADNTFPPGWIVVDAGPDSPSGKGWPMRVLPYIDASPLYNHLRMEETTLPPASDDVIRKLGRGSWRCPDSIQEDFSSERGGYPVSSYSGVYGSEPLPFRNDLPESEPVSKLMEFPTESNGSFSRNSSVRINSYIDGTSYSLMIGERSQPGQEGILPGVRSNRSASDIVTDGSHYSPMNSGPYAFSSQHRGGANFLFADGSVGFLSDKIESKPGPSGGVFQRLMNKSDDPLSDEKVRALHAKTREFDPYLE